MNVLVLCDDYWHPARTVKEGLAPLSEAGFRFHFIEDAGAWSAAAMTEFPVVLLAKSNNVSATDTSEWMTEDKEIAFVQYVDNGGGLLVVHSGSAGYAATPALRGLIGGVFDHHPPQCQVTIIPDAGHPLSAGIDGFQVLDEHYHMLYDAAGDAGTTTLAVSQSQHGSQPAGWTRTAGAGRICVLTPGHNLEVWLHPCFQILLKNALQWCAGTTPSEARQ